MKYFSDLTLIIALTFFSVSTLASAGGKLSELGGDSKFKCLGEIAPVTYIIHFQSSEKVVDVKDGLGSQFRAKSFITVQLNRALVDIFAPKPGYISVSLIDSLGKSVTDGRIEYFGSYLNNRYDKNGGLIISDVVSNAGVFKLYLPISKLGSRTIWNPDGDDSTELKLFCFDIPLSEFPVYPNPSLSF